MSFFRKPLDARHATGKEGEERAARYLSKQGYKVLYRNFRPDNGGEIDIVCRHGDELVFVEVKTRGGEKFGTPYENLRSSQQQKIVLGALAWLRLLHNPEIVFRFDVVEVRRYVDEWGCRIIENAFTLPKGFAIHPKRSGGWMASERQGSG